MITKSTIYLIKLLPEEDLDVDVSKATAKLNIVNAIELDRPVEKIVIVVAVAIENIEKLRHIIQNKKK